MTKVPLEAAIEAEQVLCHLSRLLVFPLVKHPQLLLALGGQTNDDDDDDDDETLNGSLEQSGYYSQQCGHIAAKGRDRPTAHARV
jgi:hypothetical protein